jgi:hypothetical protein
MAQGIKVVDFVDNILALEFATVGESETFKKTAGAPALLRSAIQDVLGINPQFRAVVAAGAAPVSDAPEIPSMPAPGPSIPAAGPSIPAAAPSIPAAVSSVAPATMPIPKVELPPEVEPEPEPETASSPEPEAPVSRNNQHQGASYGEPLLREILGAQPVNDNKKAR